MTACSILTSAPRAPLPPCCVCNLVQLEHKQVFLVLVTDGVPTPVMWSSHGKESDMLEASHRLVIVIKSILSKFPVALCVRLATDDEHIVRFCTCDPAAPFRATGGGKGTLLCA